WRGKKEPEELEARAAELVRNASVDPTSRVPDVIAETGSFGREDLIYFFGTSVDEAVSRFLRVAA
ncbi:MAG: thiamine-phosphate synthase family protein, partial [Fervidicoccaceae archaeon]